MPKPTREKLLSVYKRLVEIRGGEPIGERVFIRETGFSHHLWKGGFWRSWSAFQVDAGVTPNTATEKTPDDVLLRRFAELALELNSLPTEPDLMMKRRKDPSFPSKATYRRWGSRDALLKRV